MVATKRSEWRLALRGGGVGGFVGGALMTLLGLTMSLAHGRDIWPGIKGAALPFIGDRAMQPGFETSPVLIGLLTHFAVAIAWGTLFGMIAFGLSRGATLVAGVIWGLIVWVGMFYVVLPMIGLGFITRSVPIGAAILQHIVFGIGVAAGFLPFQRWRRARQPGGGDWQPGGRPWAPE